MEQALVIPIGDGQVSGLLLRPDDAKALYVFAHGAGVGMNHPSMASNALGLAERGIATLRFQFPYMEKRTGRPDPPRPSPMRPCAQRWQRRAKSLRNCLCSPAADRTAAG